MATVSGSVSLTLSMVGQDHVSKVLKDADAAMDQVGTTARGVMGRMGAGISGALRSVSDSLGEISGGIDNTIQKMAGINQAAELVGKVAGTIADAGRALVEAESRTVVLDAFARRFDESADAILRLSSAAGGIVGNVELAEMANKAALLGQNLGEVERAMEAARAISAQTGEEFRNVFDAIVETAAGTVVSADRYNELTGATLDLKKVTDEYAASIGKQASQLSVAEARLAIMPALYRDLDAQIAANTGAVNASETAWTRLGVSIGNATDGLVQSIASATQPIADWVDGYASIAAETAGATVAQARFTGSLQDVMPVLAAHLPEIQREIAAHQEWAAALDRIRGAQAAQAAQMAELAPEWTRWRQALVESLVAADKAQKAAAEKPVGGGAGSGRRDQLQRELQRLELEAAVSHAAELGKVEEIAARAELERWQAQQGLRRTALDAQVLDARLAAVAMREARQTEAALEEQATEDYRAAVAERMRLAQIDLDRRELQLADADRMGAARIELERSYLAIDAELREGAISAQIAAEERALAEMRYYSEERMLQRELEREQQAQMQADAEAALAAIDSMNGALLRSQNATAGIFGTISRLTTVVARNWRDLARGQSAAIMATSEAATAAISDERARSGVMGLVAQAVAGLELARGNLPGFIAAQGAAAGFFAVAGGAGAGGRGSGGGAVVGAGGLLGQGGGESAADRQRVQSGTFGSLGGASTVIIEGLSGQDYTAQVAGQSEAARRNGVDRRRL